MLDGLLAIFGIRFNTAFGNIAGFVVFVAGILLAVLILAIIAMCCNDYILKRTVQLKKIYKYFVLPILIPTIIFIVFLVLLYVDNNPGVLFG